MTYMNDLEKQSIIIWLISYLVTFGMDTYTTYLFLMYIGNSGYKFNDIDMDIDDFDEPLEDSLIDKIISLIPILNVFHKGFETLRYSKEMEKDLMYLKMTNFIVPMQEDEYKRFLDNKCLNTLFDISYKKEKEEQIEDFKTKLDTLDNAIKDDSVMPVLFNYGNSDVYVYFKEDKNGRKRKREDVN